MSEIYGEAEQGTKKISTKPYFLTIGLMVGILLFAAFYFHSAVTQLLNSVPFFIYAIICIVGIGLLYYGYSFLRLKKFSTNNFHISNHICSIVSEKSTRFYNILQILTGVITLVALIVTIIQITTLINNFLSNSQIAEFNLQDPLWLQPLYIIVISIATISILFLSTVQISNYSDKVQMSQLGSSTAYFWEQDIDNNIKTHNNGEKVMSYDTTNKSDNKSDDKTHHHENGKQAFTLPEYDHGFFYKKLFEINDNLLTLKQQIFVGSNDNFDMQPINELWDNKIVPYLENINTRITALEDKLQSYSSSQQDDKEGGNITHTSLEQKEQNSTKTADETNQDSNTSDLYPEFNKVAASQNTISSSSLKDQEIPSLETMMDVAIDHTSSEKKSLNETEELEDDDEYFDLPLNHQQGNSTEDTQDHFIENSDDDEEFINDASVKASEKSKEKKQPQEKSLDELQAMMEEQMRQSMMVDS